MELEQTQAKLRSSEQECVENQRKYEIIFLEKQEIERIELHDQEIIKVLERKQLELLDESHSQREYIKELEQQFNILKNQQHKVLKIM